MLTRIYQDHQTHPTLQVTVRPHAVPSCRSEWDPMLQVKVGVFQDGTIAVEATLDRVLAQWPFWSDQSLLTALTSIFVAPLDAASMSSDPAAREAALAAEEVLAGGMEQPWLYFNLIARDSHIFLPVFDMVRLQALPHRPGCAW